MVNGTGRKFKSSHCDTVPGMMYLKYGLQRTWYDTRYGRQNTYLVLYFGTIQRGPPVPEILPLLGTSPASHCFRRRATMVETFSLCIRVIHRHSNYRCCRTAVNTVNDSVFHNFVVQVLFSSKTNTASITTDHILQFLSKCPLLA